MFSSFSFFFCLFLYFLYYTLFLIYTCCGASLTDSSSSLSTCIIPPLSLTLVSLFHLSFSSAFVLFRLPLSFSRRFPELVQEFDPRNENVQYIVTHQTVHPSARFSTNTESPGSRTSSAHCTLLAKRKLNVSRRRCSVIVR